MNKKYFICMQAILMAVMLCVNLTSCKTVGYQVYEVKSPDLVQKDNSMVFENEDCKISYNLWEKNGSVAFIFENKTKKDIFIDLSQTFFIKNGAAFDYYSNRTFEKSTFDDVSLGYSVSKNYIGRGGYWPNKYFITTVAAVRTGVSSAVKIPEPEFICIPANSYKVVDVYKIMPTYVVTCDEKKDFPKKQSTLEVYEENSSPLKLRNRIAYSFEEGSKSLKFIENKFWLSSVKNYSEKEAIEKRKEKDNCYSTFVREGRYFKIGGPNQFYVPQKKKSEF